MAAIIQTASKAESLFGAGVHGFTGGDPQAAIPATSLSAAWCNAVQQELNETIQHCDIPLSDTRQMPEVLDTVVQFQRPRPSTANASAIFAFRSMSGPTFLPGSSSSWQQYRRTDLRHEQEQATVVYLGGITLPENTQSTYRVMATVIQTDNASAYGSAVLAGSWRDVAGTRVHQASHQNEAASSFGDLSFAMQINANALALRVILPAAPGKLFNVFGHFEWTAVSF